MEEQTAHLIECVDNIKVRGMEPPPRGTRASLHAARQYGTGVERSCRRIRWGWLTAETALRLRVNSGTNRSSQSAV